VVGHHTGKQLNVTAPTRADLRAKLRLEISMKSAYKPLLGLAIFWSAAGCSPEGAESSVRAGSGSAVASPTSRPGQNAALARNEQSSATSSRNAGNNAAAARGTTTPAPGAAPPPPPKPIEPGSLYTGVYTTAQADRGKEIQGRECSACHNPDDWGKGAVLGHYTGASALNLVEYLRTNMPFDGPGRLSYQEYVDVVAFLFQVNEVPPGKKELPTNQAELAKIKLEYRK
jgi:hypothetical protein